MQIGKTFFFSFHLLTFFFARSFERWLRLIYSVQKTTIDFVANKHLHLKKDSKINYCKVKEWKIYISINTNGMSAWE
jgi:hypothetical protein